MSEILKALAKELLPLMEQERGRQHGVGFKHDVSSGGSPITTGYTHGPGGLLTLPGTDPDIFLTIMGNTSMLGMLPTKGSPYMTPTFSVITGVQDVTGANKDGVCDDAPEAGLMKTCMLTSQFGRYELATKELELNRLGALNDRADPMDLRLVGDPIAQGAFMSGPADPSIPGNVLTNEVARKFWERNVAYWRLISKQLWRGNPVNNSAGGGYKEVTGFEVLVNTGHVDAVTNTACPSTDSYVRNFGYGQIGSSGTNLVAAFTDIFYQLRDRASRMGLDPVRWLVAMRPQLFYELTAIWPCSYLTFKCDTTLAANGSEHSVNNIDAQDAVRFRDEMRSGRYLLIDGQRVDVVLDDAITETNNTTNANVASGCFASDIYIIPMSVVGGRAVTFLEYFEYNNASIQQALGQMVLARVDGAFLTWPRQTNQCVQWQSKIEPRLVMRTPWLAGRLQNVVYCPVQHTRDAFPEDPYHVDGGVTQRAGPSYYQGLW